MPPPSSLTRDRRTTIAFLALIGFFVWLWIMGGASRADVVGQAFTRAFAWLLLVAFPFIGPRPGWRVHLPVLVILGFILLVPMIQLIPLPPGLWSALPGHGLFLTASELAGDPQPWRPISISPGATRNAIGSLVVPVAALALMIAIEPRRYWQVVACLLVLVMLSSVTGLLQASGARIANPFINNVPGAVSANFANRNHLALFLAIGCLLVPAWAFRSDPVARWGIPVALGGVLFFFLLILATGSRAGLVVGLVGTILGVLAVRQSIIRELAGLPRNWRIAMIAGVIAGIAGMIALSFNLDRAASVDRLLHGEGGSDLRRMALPVVWQMVGDYFPVGTGFGTFDPAYRIAEPYALLQTAYLNHAHNDLLEIVLDGGLAGALLLAAALIWFGKRSFAAWRPSSTARDQLLARLGSAIVLLVLLASAFDYPARTPMIMALLAVAAACMTASHATGTRANS